MDQTTKPIIGYRWIVFLLALGFTFYNLWTSDWSNFGGTFRKLTFWGLFLSLFSGAAMLAISNSLTDKRYYNLAMASAVLNTMVVYLYWQLYLIDPALVHDNGVGALTINNLYVHAFGPGLQIFDALFIRRAFSNRPLRAAVPIVGLVLAYVLWGELVLQNMSTFPEGSVTNGLPYPFLNSMELMARVMFYGQNIGIALAILAVYALVGWVIRKVLRSA